MKNLLAIALYSVPLALVSAVHAQNSTGAPVSGANNSSVESSSTHSPATAGTPPSGGTGTATDRRLPDSIRDPYNNSGSTPRSGSKENESSPGTPSTDRYRDTQHDDACRNGTQTGASAARTPCQEPGANNKPMD
ncbi:hypothetical protein [Eoetvoesiella caeni]